MEQALCKCDQAANSRSDKSAEGGTVTVYDLCEELALRICIIPCHTRLFARSARQCVRNLPVEFSLLRRGQDVAHSEDVPDSRLLQFSHPAVNLIDRRRHFGPIFMLIVHGPCQTGIRCAQSKLELAVFGGELLLDIAELRFLFG